ncbi:MAG: PTS glucitol/sorbitol transporter subunit IIA [Aestuariivirgaceae bacterium]|nr:PTS glucitol/sorbitol transporter subunit IIA [Aestuariivirgaceae bacterium]
MTTLYHTKISEVGAEAPDMLVGGVLILFKVGAPPELAEVSVLHEPDAQIGAAPVPGDTLAIGTLTLKITAVGDTAWKKVADIGHVVINFNGAARAERPGEICVEARNAEEVEPFLVNGAILEFRA